MSDRLELPVVLRATQDHIALIQAKRAKLAEGLLTVEGQFLTAVRREWEAGNLTWPELHSAYEQVRASDLSGVSIRWVGAGLPHRAHLVLQAKYAPNGAGGTWYGTWPLPAGDPYPLKGRDVVYVLFDDSRTPVYVGSSGNWLYRMKDHVKAGKRWASWIAHPCRDRGEAYALEARFIQQYKPDLNILTPRQYSEAA